MTTHTSVEKRSVSTWGGRVQLSFQVVGTGPALVYVPPLGGLVWDEFLLKLAEDHTIFAPELPGTSAGDTFSIHAVDDIFDLVLIYEEALRALGLVGAPVIGQSLGGMIVAELASCFPDLFGHVVLLDPAGLWFPEHPWNLDVLTGPPGEVAGLLFADPAAERPRAMLALPDDPEAAIDAIAQRTWTMGCGAKFVWPVPDRGLVKRLHRITAQVLVVWGQDDRVIPAAYAQEFGSRIPRSEVHILPACGHIPQVEQMESTYKLVTEFLTEEHN